MPLLLPFSLTKYPAIFGEVKGSFGVNNNQLGNVEILASVESSKRYFGICVDRSDCNNQLGSGRICVDRSSRNNQLGSARICIDRSGCNNQLVVVDADLDEEAVRVDEANGLDETDEGNVADRTNLADEASKTSLANAADDVVKSDVANAADLTNED
jgi:hypothetical protein